MKTLGKTLRKFKKYSNSFKQYYMLKKMGYYKDQHGIVNRFYSEKINWQPHLDNTKKYILKCAKNKVRGNVAVLGSGWLLDLPLKQLHDTFDTITLYDIVHPQQIIHQIKKEYKNVHFKSVDLTGNYVYETFKIIKNYKKTGNKLHFSKIQYIKPNFNQFDFIISLNILNQLNILLVDYLKKYNIYTKTELVEFAKIIQENHILNLPIGKSCLISDVRENLYNINGEFIKSNDLIYIDLSKSNFHKS